MTSFYNKYIISENEMIYHMDRTYSYFTLAQELKMKEIFKGNWDDILFDTKCDIMYYVFDEQPPIPFNEI